MKNLITIVLILAMLSSLDVVTEAQGGIVVKDEYQWRSSNMLLVEGDDSTSLKSTSLKNRAPLSQMAYNTHFVKFGSPPSLDFLHPLQKGSAGLARIAGEYIIFSGMTEKVRIDTSLVPGWADSAEPFIMSSPECPLIFVIYPYYFLNCKENKYLTEIYSRKGELLNSLDFFPSHVSKDNPYLLVSPERSGCCDSLKWGVRFYNLRKGSISEYSCPEGYCGDILMEKLGNNGPFVLLQEIMEVTNGIGGSLQTNIYFIDNDGTLVASGKTIFAIESTQEVSKNELDAIAPYSISKLFSIKDAPGDNTWIIRFLNGNDISSLKLVGKSIDTTPVMLFLKNVDTDAASQSAYIKFDGISIGSLPLLIVADPGVHHVKFCSAGGVEEAIKIDTKVDTINALFF